MITTQALFIEQPYARAAEARVLGRTAEGGLEHLSLYRTRDLPRALKALDPHYRTVATTLAGAAKGVNVRTGRRARR